MIKTTVLGKIQNQDGRQRIAKVKFTYDSADPYALSIIIEVGPFGPGGEEPSETWSFARDLLAEGLHTPTGYGDVRVWPESSPLGDMVRIMIDNPQKEEWAHLILPAKTVKQYLTRTFAEVPAGEEAMDLDELSAKLTSKAFTACPGRSCASEICARKRRLA